MRMGRELLLGVGLLLIGSCVSHPYSARSYRHVDTSVAYTIICHNGKKTIRVPEEEWAEHKAHYDYRGPCRPRGVPTRRQKPAPKHTVAEYEGRKARAEWSKEQWALRERALLEAAGQAAPGKVDGKAPE